MTHLTVNGLRYAVSESGQGPAVVLLHGFTGSAASWGLIRDRLAQRYRVLMIDLPGHGGTESPADPVRYAMEPVAADIVALLSRLGVERAHLVGYSMGGRLALFMALRYPGHWRSLTLESALPGLSDPAERTERVAADNALADWIEAHSLAQFVDRWEALPLFETQQRLSPQRRAEQRQQRLANHRSGLANSLRGMGTGQQPSLWSELNELKMPVHLTVGALDTKFTAIATEMSLRIPQAQLTILSGAGHTLHLEQPEAMADHVLTFLDDAANHLAQAEQQDENQSGQRHLLEPRVQSRQVGGLLNGQPVAKQHGGSQQEEVLPRATTGSRDVDNSQQDRQEQE